MLNNQPQQCDFCFQSFGPFFDVRILPITPVISLSGAATPIHARIPGTRKSICHGCRLAYWNIEPWTEPEALLSTPSSQPAYEPTVEEFNDNSLSPVSVLPL